MVEMRKCSGDCGLEKELNKELRIMCEKMYFEGQKDALNGDISIKLNCDSVYVWTKSPWTDKQNPTFIPTYLNTKNK
jgi:hypothetical protein